MIRYSTFHFKVKSRENRDCGHTWKQTELETLLGDIDRARGIYELAVEQPRLDMPEILWKAYIDFECEQVIIHRAFLIQTKN